METINITLGPDSRKLASHFALSALLAAAGEEGRSHAQLCAEAQAG